MYDVFIIGSGVSGAFIALELSQYRLRIALAEKGMEPASGSSRANSGIVHTGYDALPGTLKAKLNVRGASLMPQWAERLHVGCKVLGSMVLAFGQDDEKVVEELFKRGQANGVSGLEVISGEEARLREPTINKEVTGALYAAGTAIISPYKLTIAAAELAGDNGVEFLRGCEVTNLEDYGEYIKITTSQGVYTSRYVVNAAGVNADLIAEMLGDKSFSIIPRKGEYLILDKKEAGIVNHVIFQVPTAMGKGILVSPTVDGNVLLGPTAQNVENREDKATTAQGLEKVIQGAKKSIPSVREKSVIAMFAGMRAVSSTRDFVIGQSQVCPRLFLAAGIESPGLTSSPAIAEYLVQQMKDSGVELKKKDAVVSSRRPEIHIAELSPKEANDLICKEPAYGRIVCRCEQVSEGEIVDAIHRHAGAATVDGVKSRVRAGMGRCQGGFCTSRVVEILSRELGVPPEEVTKKGKGSEIVVGRTHKAEE